MVLEPLRKLMVDGQEIMIVDFSDLNENEMMQLVSDSRKLLLNEKKPQRLLILVNANNYVTTKVMRHIENDQKEALVYSVKQAVVGLTKPQQMILRGYNIIFNRNVRPFGTQEEAIKYLLA